MKTCAFISQNNAPRHTHTVDSEVVVRRCSVKTVFLKISQNSQDNTCARVSFLIKLQASGVNLRIQSEYRKIRTRKNSLFGHFSRRVSMKESLRIKMNIRREKKSIWTIANKMKY